MKKIGLVALVAMVALSCGKKVKTVEEAAAPTIIDSLVLVEGAGDVMSDVYGAELVASEDVPAQNVKMTFHHQQTLTNGVYETEVAVVNAETGETVTTTETGTFVTVEGEEYPIVEMKKFGGETVFFWAVKGDNLELLDADKLPLENPYMVTRYAVAPEAAVAQELEVEEIEVPVEEVEVPVEEVVAE